MPGVQNSRYPARVPAASKQQNTSTNLLPLHTLTVPFAMMVCTTCKGLQKHLQPVDDAQKTEAGALHLVDTSLPELRGSAAGCRACGLLLQGILLHHDHFHHVKETSMRITAESFRPSPERSRQDHLSVEVRWKEQHDDDEHEHDYQGHAGWPNLKLEFFTDGGKFPLQQVYNTCPLGYRRHVRGARITRPSGLVRTWLTFTDGQSSFSAIGRGRQISTQPLQDAGLASVRDLLKTCLSSHSKCRQPKSTTLPKRVLDVLGDDSKSVRLHESDFKIGRAHV